MNISSHPSQSSETSSIQLGSSLVTARSLALGAVFGPIMFTLAWFILGFMSPGYTLYGMLIAPYSPISQPISGLGLGSTAPFMNAAFVLCGLLQLIGVVGIFQRIREISPIARWSCAALLMLSSLGIIVDGIFTLEAGFIHYMGFMLADATAILGFLIAGLVLHRIPSWRALGTSLLIGSPLTLVLTVLFFATFNANEAGAGLGVAGLAERMLVIGLQGWFVTLGWFVFRRS